MKRTHILWFGGALLAPAIANAQVPIYPNVPPPPVSLDPAAPPSTTAPAAPTPAPAPAKPAVVIVGPDGKVIGGDAQSSQPAKGYYADPTGGAGNVTPAPGDTSPLAGGLVPELHVVRPGDTLWDICFTYFNDPWQWPKIWSYNQQITNPHWIYPGDLIRLLPKGVFAQVKQLDPEKGGDVKPVPAEKLPAPTQKLEVGVRQVAFVEQGDLDNSTTIDGAPDEKVLLGDNDSVYLSYPKDHPPEAGKTYSIYVPDNSVKSKGKTIGAYVHVLGTVQITSVKENKRARGLITGANLEITRGAKVGPLVTTFKNVPPKEPKVSAQGNIVAMLRREQLIGQGEVVFVDLGKNSGIEVGNRMFVVRRGDGYPRIMSEQIGQDDRRFPARALGEVVVVDIGEHVAVCLVTLSVQEMSVGDQVMMQKPEPPTR